MKSIKIILLSFSLAASLAVTSYAMSPNKNKNKTTTVSTYNLRYNLRNRSKDILSYLEDNLKKIQLNKNKSKNKISTSENKKSMEINTSKDDMEIDQIEEKKIPTQKITIQSECEDKYYALLDFYHRHFGTLTEYQDRTRIKQLLKQFKKLFPVDSKNNIIKNKLSKMSISDFNQLQSILLDYYNFSVSFTDKYSPFTILTRTHTETLNTKFKTNKYIYYKYFNFYTKFYRFLTSISQYVKILNNFCYNLLFENEFNKAIQDLYFNKIKTKKSTNNEELNGKTSEQLSGLSSDLQEIFHNTQTEMTPQSTIWGKTFSKDKFTNNTFIDEDTAYNKFEVMPKISQNYEIPIDLKDKIPHQYKINSHILAAVYKMELLKSQYYMKKFKDNPLEIENENNESVFKSYDEAKKYANDIFKTYNSLRSFIVLDKGLSFMNSGDKDNTTALEIFKKDAKSFNEALKKYTSDKTNNVYDLISFLICEFKKNSGNSSDKKNLYEFISKSDFKNKYQIASILDLYNHISNNNEYYNQLFEISKVQDLKKFYSQMKKNIKPINTNSNPNKEDGYQSLDKFLDPNVIERLKNEEPKNKKSKNEELKNKRSYTTRNLNLNIAQGLLDYYNRNWHLDKNRRQNIVKRFEDFDEIYNNLNSKDKIQKNANLLNENFNSLQSILLDYYKFLLFFSKYNTLIKTITTKTFKMQNYDQLKDLTERNLFVDNYKSFTDSIKERIANIKTFVNEMLTENFKDPKNTNIAIPETTLKDFSAIRKEILKLEPNFKEIFKIMEIDKITGNKVLDEKTYLEDIDVIPEIDKNKAYLQLYSINAAPPHYRVNLDILATILKMEILKWLPYFKKMPNTKALNYQENNTDINFTKSKKEMGNYINTIYQFYDKLKSYMVWSMNDPLLYIRNCAIYSDKDMLVYPIRVDRIMGKKEDFMKKIQAYIKDDNQFYTTFYLPPDESENSSNESNESSDESNDSLEDSSKKLSLNLFKLYYNRRQNCAYKDRSQVTLFTKHILKKQKIYDNFMNNQDPDISDMKLLDQFFSRLDPGYFDILPKVNANKNNPTFVIHKNILLKENKDNKKPIIKPLKKTKLKRNNSNQNTLAYNNASNYPSIFKKNRSMFEDDFIFSNYFLDQNDVDNIDDIKNLNLQKSFEKNYNIINDNLMPQRKKDEKHNKKTNKNSGMKKSKKDEKQNIQDEFFNLCTTRFNRNATNQNLQNQFEKNEDPMNNNITFMNLENNLDPLDDNLDLWPILYNEQNEQDDLDLQHVNFYDELCKQPMQYNLTNLGATGFKSTTKQRQFNRNANHTRQNAVYKDATKKQNTKNQNAKFKNNLKRNENQMNNNALNEQNIMSEDLKNRFDDFLKFINNPNKQNTQNTRFEDNLNENYENLTQTKQNKQQHIQNDENDSKDSHPPVGGTHNTRRKKGKKPKKTKPVLGRKTSRKNTKTPMKKHKPSKKKK